jgi:hypothetical protein
MDRELTEELTAVLRRYKDSLDISEEEILFIAFLMTGFAYSSAPVRQATVPALKAAIKLAMDMMRAQGSGERNGQPN